MSIRQYISYTGANITVKRNYRFNAMILSFNTCIVTVLNHSLLITLVSRCQTKGRIIQEQLITYLTIIMELIIPPTNKVWVVYRNHLVCLSVQYYSVHIFLMEKLWKFLLHTKIAYELRVCRDLDPKLYAIWQVQGHWKEKFIICVCFISF